MLRSRNNLPSSFSTLVVATSLLALVGCGGLAQLAGDEEDSSGSESPEAAQSENTADFVFFFGAAPASGSMPSMPLALTTVPTSEEQAAPDGDLSMPVPAEVAEKPPLSEEELGELRAQDGNKVQAEGAKTLQVLLSAEGQEPREASVDLSKSNEVIFANLEPGKWSVSIKMLDAQGKVLLEGKGDIEAVAGQSAKNSANLALEVDDKTGALSLVVKTPDAKSPGGRPLPSPSLFVNIHSKKMYMEAEIAGHPGGCGRLRTTLMWQAGRAEVTARTCASGEVVERGFVIEKPEALHALRHFIADFGREIKAVQVGASAPAMGCLPEARPPFLVAKFEDAQGKTVSRAFSANPMCAAQLEQFGKVDGHISGTLLAKFGEELVTISRLMGKRVSENNLGRPEPLPAPDQSDTIESLTAVRNQIRDDLKAALRLDCRANLDCVVVPFGAVACGGPEGFLVASRIASDMVQVGQLRDKEIHYTTHINRLSNAVSTCAAVAQPVAACNTTTRKCEVK